MDGWALFRWPRKLNIRVYDGWMAGWMDELAMRVVNPVSAAADRAERLID